MSNCGRERGLATFRSQRRRVVVTGGVTRQFLVPRPPKPNTPMSRYHVRAAVRLCVLGAMACQTPPPVQTIPSPATSSVVARVDSSPTVPAARPADVASVDAILTALYDVISGPAGQPRDWNRFRSLFIPGARLIPTGRTPDGAGRVRVFDAEQYVTLASPGFEKNGFFERETARRTERFGNIVHAFSTYESKRMASDSVPFARGINSIQLWNDTRRWWVVTIFWEGERPDNPIPARYLQSSSP